MINQNYSNKQLPTEIKAIFKELKISQHLRNSGISKSMGISCTVLFTFLFSLAFKGKSIFQMTKGREQEQQPRKDAVYRFLNQPTYNWRKFLLLVTSLFIAKVTPLTSTNQPKVLILDDSTYKRSRSKRVELLSWCHDHVEHKNFKGF